MVALRGKQRGFAALEGVLHELEDFFIVVARTVGHQVAALNDKVKRRNIRQVAHGAHGVFLSLFRLFNFAAREMGVGEQTENDVAFFRLCGNFTRHAAHLGAAVIGQHFGSADRAACGFLPAAVAGNEEDDSGTGNDSHCCQDDNKP